MKSEVREDDAEINALARKMMEQNRQKMNPAVPGVVPGGGGPMQMVRPGQPGIQNYLSYQQQQAHLQAHLMARSWPSQPWPSALPEPLLLPP